MHRQWARYVRSSGRIGLFLPNDDMDGGCIDAARYISPLNRRISEVRYFNVIFRTTPPGRVFSPSGSVM